MANIDAADETGRTALHLAVQQGYYNIVIELLNSAANINVKDHDGLTALHLAVQYGYTNIAIELLNRGADINLRDRNRRTALHLAMLQSNQAIIQVLNNVPNHFPVEPSIHNEIPKQNETCEIIIEESSDSDSIFAFGIEGNNNNTRLSGLQQRTQNSHWKGFIGFFSLNTKQDS